MTLDLPRFGADRSKVSGFTEPGHDVYARVFVPLELSGTGQYIPWSIAARQTGTPLRALTTWDDVERAAGRDPAWQLPRGTVDDRTARALVRALARQGQDGAQAPIQFALWEGYAGEIDGLRDVSPSAVPVTGHSFLGDGSFHLLTAPLDWVMTRTRSHRVHFPVALWPDDHAFVVATGLYQDSLYLSCSRELFAAARAAGLDLVDIDPDVPVPSRGD